MGRGFSLFVKCSLLQILIVSLLFAAFTRTKHSINETGWKFKRADVAGAQQPSFDDGSWQTVTIPHDFNGGIDGVNDDVFTGPNMYRGIGWYRTHFTVDNAYQGKKIFIQFEAVSLVADVWLNGTSLGQHKGGYTAFTFDITEQVNFGADNVLAVKANSANDPKIAPWMQVPFGAYPTSYDYAVYGGIYRDVWIIVTDKVKIEATYQTTPNLTAAAGEVRVKTEVKNYDNAAQSVTLTTEIVDVSNAVVKTMENTQSIAAGQTYTFDQTSSAVSNPHLWSPDDPYLYKVKSRVVLGAEEVDQIENALGFRWFTHPVAGQAFKLNGQNCFIHGTNRHQDWEGKGYALSNANHRHDVELIKGLGLNFVRHAHYPADPAFMQACDELGLLVWLEIPVTCVISTDAAFLDNAKNQLQEMIQQNYNHPSVIIWGIGNESDQGAASVHPELTEAYTNTFNRALDDLSHSIDNTRPTTGCNWKFGSNTGIVDAYSPQDWAGWYGGNYTNYNPSSLIGEYGADAAIDRHKEEGGTTNPFTWSQEYQCKLHEAFVARAEAKKTQFPGHNSWILADFGSPRSDRTISHNNTIDYMNQKGLYLHDHTTPKDVAFFYKSLYTDGKKTPMVYIVSHTWLDRWSAPAAKNVWVYSNCEEVELYNAIGSESFGSRTKTAGENAIKTRFQWDDILVKYNVLYAEGLIDGKVVARDTIILQNLPEAPAAVVAPVKQGVDPYATLSVVTADRGTSVRLTLNRDVTVGLSLYALNGSMVASRPATYLTAGRRLLRLHSGTLARGIYYVRAEADGFHWAQKITVR